MPKCEKCGKDILNAERRELSVLHISGVYCDVCYNLLNGLNWVMGASLYGSVWHSLSLQEKSDFIKHYKEKPREKCIAHLKSLFQNAMSIQVYDKYLYVTDRPAKDNIELLSNILRLMDESACRTLTVYDSKPSIKMGLARIAQHCKRTFPTITVRVVSSSTFIEKHDRYLIVNSSSGKVEILLSSGFENLFDNSKDFTYMIRPI